MVQKLKDETYKGRMIEFTKFKNGVKGTILPLGPSVIGSSKNEVFAQLKYKIDKIEARRRELEKSYDARFNKKRIYYYKTEKKIPRRMGGANVTVSVYRHTNDGLKHLGEVKWNTASYKGEKSEVLDFLKREGQIAQQMFPQGYYSSSDAEKYNMVIRGL